MVFCRLGKVLGLILILFGLSAMSQECIKDYSSCVPTDPTPPEQCSPICSTGGPGICDDSGEHPPFCIPDNEDAPFE
ncbi:Hypothetical predicted protein [Paramuricea clavata]|uniref:Uncharacterized protein n=1 Tax=Paramuricea clavata TaxID=317549 RepID=A0A6S7HXD7_PARCT|nr:Hypothetical predicted protein [Paramuricea clavata]